MPPSDPQTLGIPDGAAVTIIQQETTFPVESHAPTSGTEQNLHRAMMGGTTTLQNTGVGGTERRE